MTQPSSARSLRRLYLEWVEEQIEDFKDSVPRSELLRIADEVITELEMNRRGQYQLTELLLCEEVDRAIALMLKLPGFRAWAATRPRELASAPLTVTPASEPSRPAVEELRHEPIAVSA